MSLANTLLYWLEKLIEARDVRNFYENACAPLGEAYIVAPAPTPKLPNWEQLEDLKDRVLLPNLRNGQLGKLAYLPIELILPDEKYEHRYSILKLIAEGDEALLTGFRETGYFQDQVKRSDEAQALLKLFRYRQLFTSIKHHGFRFDVENLDGLPLVFMANHLQNNDGVASPDGDFVMRLDGTHRASVARYLGYRELAVQAVELPDVLALPDLPARSKTLLKRLRPFQSSQADFVAISESRASVEKAVRETPNWYQDIQFLPRLSTISPEPDILRKLSRAILRPEQPLKDEALMSALPDLTGRKVLDLGCNAGLHSMHSRWRGAKSVLGIDIEQERIDQANLVKSLFAGLGYRANNIEFQRMNIMENLEVLDGIDTVLACCMLYHLGPVDKLKEALRNSKVDYFFLQCNTVRGEKIGKKNKPGHPNYEKANKTWGNILGTVDGGKRFLTDIGFSVQNITMSQKQFPTLVGVRN